MTPSDSSSLVVVLVRPTQPRNVGAAIRAAANFGVERICAVTSEAWDEEEERLVRVASAGAWDVVGGLRFASTLAEATSDCSIVAGTSARTRAGIVPVTPEQFFHAPPAGKIAVVFGPESQGLSAAELALCHAVIRIPTSDAFPSMNLSHAVALVCYEAARTMQSARSADVVTRASIEAEEGVVSDLVKGLAAATDVGPRDATRFSAQLRRLVHRANPTEKDIGLLNRLAKALRPK